MENLGGRHLEQERGVGGVRIWEFQGLAVCLEFGIPRLGRIGTAGMENWIFAGWGHCKQQNF